MCYYKRYRDHLCYGSSYHLGEPVFSDNARTRVILVGLAIVVIACIALYTTRQHKSQAVEADDPRKIALKAAMLKIQLDETKRELAWNKKQLDMVRFSGNAESATAAGFASTIAELERQVRRTSAELLP